MGSEVRVIVTKTRIVTRHMHRAHYMCHFTVAVTNDRAVPVTVEVMLIGEGERTIVADPALNRRDGRRYWEAVVPANATRTLRYRLTG